MKFAAFLMAVTFISGRGSVWIVNPEYAQTEASLVVSLLTALAVGIVVLAFVRKDAS